MSIYIENIKQNWKVNIKDDNKVFPYLYIDNWYTKEEEKIWKELDFHSSLELSRAEDTIVAKIPGTDKPLGYHYRMYLNEIYTPKGQYLSPIHKYMYKFRDQQFWEIIEKTTSQGRNFKATNASSTFVSYYEDGDDYGKHFDTSMFTCLIWMHRKNKQYTGGDFIFTESDSLIESKNNRMIMFPCHYYHKVTPIKFNKKPKEIGQGRYTITHFFSRNIV